MSTACTAWPSEYLLMGIHDIDDTPKPTVASAGTDASTEAAIRAEECVDIVTDLEAMAPRTQDHRAADRRAQLSNELRDARGRVTEIAIEIQVEGFGFGESLAVTDDELIAAGLDPGEVQADREALSRGQREQDERVRRAITR